MTWSKLRLKGSDSGRPSNYKVVIFLILDSELLALIDSMEADRQPHIDFQNGYITQPWPLNFRGVAHGSHPTKLIK